MQQAGSQFSICLMFVLLCLTCSSSYAVERDHLPIAAIQKIAVFPVDDSGELLSRSQGSQVDDLTLEKLDETWWQVREELTNTGRFVVATKAFLQRADVFTPRGELRPSEVVILGKYVEADAVLTLQLKQRTLTVRVWSSDDGNLVWKEAVSLHPSLLIRDQIVKIARSVVRDFISEVPYHGTTVMDLLARSPVFMESGKTFAKVDIGSRAGESNGSAMIPGQTVQWLKLERVGLDPLFQGGGKTTVIAEGIIRDIADRVAKVEVLRIASGEAITNGSLLYVPAEAERLLKNKDPHARSVVLTLLARDRGKKGTPGLDPEGVRVQQTDKENRPFATSLSFIGSLAVILLLAF